MENEKKPILSEDYLRKFKHRAGYVVNETPKYRPLVGTNEEFDEVPVLTNEAGEQEDVPKPEGQVPPAPSNDLPIEQGGEEPINSPVPAFDAGGEADPMAGEQPAVAPVTGEEQPIDPMGAPVEPEAQVDTLQNDIIKHNIEAMKSIHDELSGLVQTVQGLNTKMDGLNAEVEEIREPNNSEILMNKTSVSYPYYLNLNDMWQNNWFDQKREGESEKGMKKLPDGTFVADFDDLPQKSKIDVQNSFNEI